MKNKLKIWSGVGTYFLANVGAIALSTTDVARADMSLLTADESNVVISQGGEGSSGKTCKAVAVSGGGEGGEESATPTSGGEGGEGGEGAPTPSTQPTGGGEGGEGGEGAPTPSTQPTGGGEGGTGASGGTTIFKPRSSQPVVGNNARASVKFDDRQLLNDFTDQLVIPTYRALAGKSGQLSTAVNAFVSKPNSSTLNAARQAWLATRTPWEQSEAFAFGPAASLGYDADLDDWPINEVDLNKVLNSQNALTADYVSKLQTSQKGFHTIEFLLFGVDNNKQLQNFTKRDLEYLQAVTTAFERTANQLLISWTEGVNGNPPYRDTFVKAGNDSTAYPTVQAAAEEIVQGILGILDEVASTKIGEALEEQNPFLLESRFSNSSLRDFQANLRSAQIAYLGQLPDAKTRGKSLSEFVASVDPALDTEVRQQMQGVIATLAAVPGPIERTLCDSQAGKKIEAAKDAILALHTTIAKRVLPLVQE